MPDLTHDQRDALVRQAEALIDQKGLHGETAYVYGIPAGGTLGIQAVILTTARGEVHFTCSGDGAPACYTEGYVHSWRVDHEGAPGSVDNQLRDLQKSAAWVALFTLNACACEGDGRVWLSGAEMYHLRDHDQTALAMMGVCQDEGRMYRPCQCGADTPFPQEATR